MAQTPLTVLVLAGGPDRERAVSLQSGGQVAQALREAGHQVTEADVLPDDLSAIEDAKANGIDVVFPVLHGPWGEGGPLQAVLEASGLAFVGCREKPARLCMDKWEAKQVLLDHRLPTPEAELLRSGDRRTLKAPVVVKAIDEGSSYALKICHDELQADVAVAELMREHDALLVERFVEGRELTVGVIDSLEGDGPVALPAIHIVPAVAFYDYEAKYTRDDTQYNFDLDPPELGPLVQELALRAFRGLGCRHLARVDFLVDDQLNPWILEANTMPGFTSHSLLPKAAAKHGIPFPDLCDRLVRMALGEMSNDQA